MTRPPHVPADWICAPCTVCKGPTWYPPDAEAKASAQGVPCLIVCSAACALHSVQFWEPADNAAGKLRRGKP